MAGFRASWHPLLGGKADVRQSKPDQAPQMSRDPAPSGVHLEGSLEAVAMSRLRWRVGVRPSALVPGLSGIYLGALSRRVFTLAAPPEGQETRGALTGWGVVCVGTEGAASPCPGASAMAL